METRLEAVPSPTRLWWSKIGKWQALMVVAALAAFFVTLGITSEGDTKNTVAAAFAVTVVATAVAVVAFAAFAIATATFAVAAAFVAAAFVAAAAAFAVTVVATVAAATFTALAFAALAFVAVVVIAAVATKEVRGISKKTVWLSYMGESCLILLPMLWVLRG